jgi:hypothetical protein
MAVCKSLSYQELDRIAGSLALIFVHSHVKIKARCRQCRLKLNNPNLAHQLGAKRKKNNNNKKLCLLPKLPLWLPGPF